MSIRSYLNKRVHVILLFFFYCFLVSCSDFKQSKACSFASEQVTITDKLSANNKTYYLVYRISGWHEKIESFELYDSDPSFDHCGKSTIKPLFAESIEDKDFNNKNQHVARIDLISPSQFSFHYEPGVAPKINYYKSLTLQLQKPE